MDQAASGASALLLGSTVDSAVRVETLTAQAPHNAVKAEALSVFAGARCLLADTELKIAEQTRTAQVQAATGELRPQRSGTCYGLVGPNGCGKSTLLRLVQERHVPVPHAWDVFLVSQHLSVPRGATPVEEVLSASARRTELLLRQAELQEELSGPEAEEDFELARRASSELEALQAELARWDGAESEAAELLVAVGFKPEGGVHIQGSDPTVATPMGQLSGGWRMKVELAKALWLKPRLLLLDEPTNHLDFKALRWLEQQLEEYPHTSIVVSHDVSFLHGVCHEILWIRDCKLESLPRDTVTREDLIRMQRRRALRFKFQVPEGTDVADHGLSLHGVEFGYGGSSGSGQPAPFHVQGDVRFSGRSRAVVLGRNGSGKSTFLKLCVGELQPSRGQVDRTPELQVGYYSQLTEELDRYPRDTAAGFLVRHCREALAAHAGSTRSTRLREALAARASQAERAEQHASLAPPEQGAAGGRAAKALVQEKRLLEVARATLSHFGFEGEVAVSVPAECLSGGQKACLKFAALSLTPCHVLVLDEPTNHLDAEACEALARGLSEFEGGVVAVTHDELLIYRLIHCNWSSSELLVCRGGCLRRLRNFGAGCLDALKKEVHGAEEEEAAAAAPGQRGTARQLAAPAVAGAAKPVRSTALPPWLARASRQRNEAAAGSEDLVNNSQEQGAAAAAVAGHAQETAAAARSPEDALPAATRRLVGLTERKMPVLRCNRALDAPTPSRALARGRTDSLPALASVPEAAAQPPRAAPTAERPQSPVPAAPAAPAVAEAPDSWEDLEEDAAEEDAHGSGRRAPAAELARDDSEREGQDSAARSDPSKTAPRSEGGRRSRARRDLVNLNKAAAKWLRQEGRGEVSRDEIVGRIRNSLVARHLRATQGIDFREDHFVRDVLERAATADAARGEARVGRRSA